ncbi:MAG TPA: acetate uptake transporter [Dermatophilaceae bacterium]|nr:acetate uptake transporter [Dermatophilaceae bacterium]
MTQVLTRPSTQTQTVSPPSLGAQIADPAPLGLAAFVLTTFMLSTFNAGLLPKSAEVAILGVALFYGGITQLFAGMWEFAKGNTFGALAFSSYGAFWMSFWYLVEHSGLTKADAPQGVGIFLLAWTIFSVFMTVVTARISGLLFTLFSVLVVTFVFLTVGSFASAPALTHIGGYLGLITAGVAWYASFAGVLNATARKVVMPTWPR